jgi:lipoprotein-anchoring transpeptidase ErfK/SrfK
MTHMLRRIAIAVAFIGFSTSAFAEGMMFPDFFNLGGSDDSVAAPNQAHHTSVLRHATPAPAQAAGARIQITIDISTQTMTVAEGNDTIYQFDVSTGRAGHATPTGTFHPQRMNEIWYSSKYENAPMPWSIFFYGGYAIHGTTDVKHLGHVASHGCVRLDPANAKLLYDLVKDVGMQNTKVVLYKS